MATSHRLLRVISREIAFVWPSGGGKAPAREKKTHLMLCTGMRDLMHNSLPPLFVPAMVPTHNLPGAALCSNAVKFMKDSPEAFKKIKTTQTKTQPLILINKNNFNFLIIIKHNPESIPHKLLSLYSTFAERSTCQLSFVLFWKFYKYLHDQIEWIPL